MKCIQCGTENNLKDRTANLGGCSNCQHKFAFEPTSMGSVKITDPFFVKAIADISVNHTLYFTYKQFLYFLDKRLRAKSFGSHPLLLLLLLLFINTFLILSFLNTSLNPFFIPLLVDFVVIVYLFQRTQSNKVSKKIRQACARQLRRVGILFILIGILYLLVLQIFSVFAVSVIIGMISIYLGYRQLSKTGLAQEFLFTQDQFKGWIDRWTGINGDIVRLLHPPLETIAPGTVHPDVSAYSFDRLVVCDSAVFAQFLIANNFHFENNCAILSITGYPQSIFDTTMEMLHRNPDLKVYALHDCSPKGMNLVNHLRTSPKWFPNTNVAIIDIGLLPRQIIASKRGMFIRANDASAQAAKQLSPEIRTTLTAEELQWLDAGNFVELESFSPQQLIHVLNRGIAGSRDLDSADTGFFIVGGFGSDTYTAQTFG